MANISKAALMGNALRAEGLRQQANSVIEIANYQNQLLANELGRNLFSMSRKLERTISSQNVDSASSGFAGASKSSLLVASDILATFEKEARFARQRTNERQSLTKLQAQARADSLRYQAGLAEAQSILGGMAGGGGNSAATAYNRTPGTPGYSGGGSKGGAR